MRVHRLRAQSMDTYMCRDRMHVSIHPFIPTATYVSQKPKAKTQSHAVVEPS